MASADLKEFKELFAEGTGFGDPQERENAELRVQIAMAGNETVTQLE